MESDPQLGHVASRASSTNGSRRPLGLCATSTATTRPPARLASRASPATRSCRRDDTALGHLRGSSSSSARLDAVVCAAGALGGKMPVRIVTWNVNGVRNPFKYAPWNRERTLQAMFDLLEADIVCFQEVKTPKASLTDDLVFVPGWDAFYSFPQSQTGYSGVAVYTRDRTCVPLRVEEGVTGALKRPGTAATRYLDDPAGIGGYPTDRQLRGGGVGREALDAEGRCLVLAFPLFVLVNVYCPARRDAARTGFRNAFLRALDARVRNLAAAGRSVVLCGDLNIVRDRRDTAAVWGRGGQLLPAEARDFDRVYRALRAPRILNGLVYNSLPADGQDSQHGQHGQHQHPPALYDACRERHPQRLGMYTCWDTRKNHRPANFGARIDYVLCSRPLLQHLVADADIQPHLLGSDHCPVYVVLRDCVEVADPAPTTKEDAPPPEDHPPADPPRYYTRDYLNPPGRFVAGQRALADDDADAARFFARRLPQSARRMPRFANRRHIANMFRGPSAPSSSSSAGKPPSPPPPPAQDPAAAHTTLPALLRGDVVALVEPPSDEEDDDEEDDDEAAAAYDEAGGKDEGDGVPRAGPPPLSRQASLSFTRAPVRPPPPAPPAPAQGPETARPTEEAPAPAPAPSPTPTSTSTLARAQSQPPLLFAALAGRGAATASTAKPPAPRRSLARTASAGAAPSSSPSAAAATAARPAKKARTTKAAPMPPPTSSASSGGQTSISMFLRARDSSSRPAAATAAAEADAASTTAPPAPTEPSSAAAAPSAPEPEPDEPPWLSAEEVDAAFRHQDAARASWSRLGLGQQRAAPLCEHGEPCKTFVARKPGVNSGRSFYMCARPPGPLGRREKGTPWQCTTFVWLRDWKPERPEA